MALKIVTGGTTGLADGTLVSSSNKIVFTALDTAVDCHVRSDDDTYSADASFTMPAEVQVSFDGGSTWKTSSTNPNSYGVDIGDLNVAIKLRQHTNSSTSTGTFQTDSTTPAATALGTAATPTLTVLGPTSIRVNSSCANASSFRVERSPNGSTGWTTVAASTALPYDDPGLTASTAYYYRVTGLGTVRYKDGPTSATANATTSTPVAFTDTFSTGTVPDSTRFGTSVAGSSVIDVSGGVCRLRGATAETDGSIIWLKDKLDSSRTEVIEVRLRYTTAKYYSGTQGIIDAISGMILYKGTTPGVMSNTSWNPDQDGRLYPNAGQRTDLSYHQGWHANYYDGVAAGFKSLYADGSWGTSPPEVCAYDGVPLRAVTGWAANATLDNPGPWQTFIWENDATNNRWRFRVRAADDTTYVFSTNWVSWANMRSTTPWLVLGDQYNNYYWHNFEIDYVTRT